MSNASDFVIENGVLIKYVGKEKNITIPEAVREIGDKAFSDQAGIKTVVCPHRVERIGRYAFSKCTGMISIVIMPGLKLIDRDAFSGCKKLTQISLPDSLEIIEGGAFSECKSLDVLEIPQGLKKLGAGAFYQCKNLKSIDVPNGAEVLFDDHVSRCSSLEFCHIPGFSFKSYKTDEKTNLAIAVLAAFDRYTQTDKAELLKYLKKQCKEILWWVIMNNNAVALTHALSEGLVNVKTIDEFIDLANDNDKQEMLAILLDYKAKHFSSSEIEKERARKERTELNYNPLSVKELKKLWAFDKMDDGTLRIRDYKKEDAHVEVPAMIGKSCVSKLVGCFNYWEPDKTLISVSIPEGIAELLSVFYNCYALEEVHLPRSAVRYDRCFNKCPKLKIYAPAGSYAETYAKENNIPFVAE